MQPGTYEGKAGYLDEGTGTFYAKDLFTPGTYEGKLGILHKESGQFYPITPAIKDPSNSPSPGVGDWLTRVLPSRIGAAAKGLVSNITNPPKFDSVWDIPKLMGIPAKEILEFPGNVAANIMKRNDVSINPNYSEGAESVDPLVQSIVHPLDTAKKIPRMAYEYSPDIIASLATGPMGVRAATRMAEGKLLPILEKVSNVTNAPGKAVGRMATSWERSLLKAKAEVDSLPTIDASINRTINTNVDSAIRPGVSGKKNRSGIESFHHSADEGVKDIISNKDALRIANRDGNIVPGKLPESLDELSQAIDQRMKQHVRRFDQLQEAAGLNGSVGTLSGAIKELTNLVEGTHLPEIQSYAKGRLDWLKRELSNNGGVISPGKMQDILAELNQKAKAYYLSPSYETATSSGIDKLLANQIRKEQYDIVTKGAGPGYDIERKAFGSLKDMESDVNRRLVVDARKNIKGLADFSDMWTAADLVEGLTSLNPTHALKGVARLATKVYLKHSNNPNSIVKELFDKTDKLMQRRDLVAQFKEAMQGQGQGIPTMKALPPGPNVSSNPEVGITRGLFPGRDITPVTPEKLSIAQRKYVGGQASIPGASLTKEDLIRLLGEKVNE